MLVLLAAGGAALAIAAAVELGFGRATAGPVATPAAGSQAVGHVGGCSLVASRDGYPDSYMTRPIAYKRHPPLPVSGWHGPSSRVAFDVLFHSIFHGYLVVAYRPDLAPADQAALRRWVGAHTGKRVVGTPTADPAAPRLDLAEWGWELRCDHAIPTRGELDRFAARRRV